MPETTFYFWANGVPGVASVVDACGAGTGADGFTSFAGAAGMLVGSPMLTLSSSG
jgi:hypothetical protein